MTKEITAQKKQAQPHAVLFLSEEERKVIKQTVAKSLSDAQYSVFVYTCQALGLNPLLGEITAIVYGGTMSIQTMRDGFLTIAHRSGKFAGLESGVTMSEDGKTILNGWAKVYHKDFTVPVYQEADFSEYTTGRNLWVSKPKTMIKKVAESMALRKAFNISGVYSAEEMEKEVEQAKPTLTEQALDSEFALDDEHIKKIDDCKTLKELTATCGALKKELGKDYEKPLMKEYTRKKKELVA